MEITDADCEKTILTLIAERDEARAELALLQGRFELIETEMQNVTRQLENANKWLARTAAAMHA